MDIMSSVSNPQRVRALIQTAMDVNGWTQREVAERSKGQISKSTISNLMTEGPREEPIPVKMMQGLSTALGLPLAVIKEAADADVGITDLGDEWVLPETAILTALITEVTPEARAEAVRMAADVIRLFKR